MTLKSKTDINSTMLVHRVGGGQPDPTKRFPNHARLIHPDDISGFCDENLAKLASILNNTFGW